MDLLNCVLAATRLVEAVLTTDYPLLLHLVDFLKSAPALLDGWSVLTGPLFPELRHFVHKFPEERWK